MGRFYIRELCGRVYNCGTCGTHLARGDDVIQKDFVCWNSKGYFIKDVANVTFGMPQELDMLSGRYGVNIISCVRCSQVVGWKYCKAYRDYQQYKEGKFVLNRSKMGVTEVRQ